MVNAYLAMTITTPLDSPTVASMLDTEYDQGISRSDQYKSTKMAPGMIMKLAPGDAATSHNPGRPNPAFEGFMKSFYMSIGSGLGLPIEVLRQNWSDSNYSSARAALGELWQMVAQDRKLLADGFLNPVYEMVIEEAIDLGLLDAPDFYRDRHLYCGARWIGPGRGYLDPVKEADAAKIRLETISTYEDECAEQGKDYEEVLEQQAYEQERRRLLNLPPLVPPTPGTVYPSDEQPPQPAKEKAA